MDEFVIISNIQVKGGVIVSYGRADFCLSGLKKKAALIAALL